MRLDVAMAERGTVKSRERAQAMILAGEVYVNGIKAEKAGATVGADDVITIREDPIPFVSRGGLKLQKALEVFPISLNGCTCADIGASTGGFTDCMLQHGAKRVYAVDVGYGQLDWSLRSDPRVVVMERTNARFMEPGWFETPLSFASIDVSFISLKLIVPPLFGCLADDGQAVALIKPQFEAGRSEVGKNGVVRDAAVHRTVIERVIEMADAQGFTKGGLDFSPITGPKGNIEFLLWLTKDGNGMAFDEMRIDAVVDRAHIACIK